ncbi:hypothetical protein Bca4012_049248 [Brassica carinata]
MGKHRKSGALMLFPSSKFLRLATLACGSSCKAVQDVSPTKAYSSISESGSVPTSPIGTVGGPTSSSDLALDADLLSPVDGVPSLAVSFPGQAEGSSAVSDLPVDCNLSRIVVDNWTEEVEKQTDAPESKSLAEDSIKTSLARKQTVSLDQIMGFSTVHVYHEEGGSFAGPRDGSTDDLEAPFLLVNNRKSSRKATKA